MYSLQSCHICGMGWWREVDDVFLPGGDPGHGLFEFLSLRGRLACEFVRLSVIAEGYDQSCVWSDHLQTSEQLQYRQEKPLEYFERASPPLRASIGLLIDQIHLDRDDWNDGLQSLESILPSWLIRAGIENHGPLDTATLHLRERVLAEMRLTSRWKQCELQPYYALIHAQDAIRMMRACAVPLERSVEAVSPPYGGEKLHEWIEDAFQTPKSMRGTAPLYHLSWRALEEMESSGRGRVQAAIHEQWVRSWNIQVLGDDEYASISVAAAFARRIASAFLAQRSRQLQECMQRLSSGHSVGTVSVHAVQAKRRQTDRSDR